MTPTDLEAVSTCHGFILGLLQLESYEWAERIFADLDKRGAAVAVKACNGAGKTERVAAPIALWHAAIFPKSLTVATSGVFRQVEQQLFGAIEAHRHRFPGWTFNNCEVVTHTGSRILGFSTDQPGRFEGWHADNLLLIADEAKTVPDSIFEAMARCQPTRTLLLSSPGGCSGEFYRAFGERKKFYTCHSIPATLCPHIKGEWIAAQVEKYGESHPLIRSMIYAEFMSGDEDSTVIPVVLLERCLTNPPAFTDNGDLAAFCDFAAGGDENVLAIRRGNRVEIAAAWTERDTMRAVGRFIQLFREHNLPPSRISGDEGGLGKVMLDALREAGYDIHRVNNGGAPFNAQAYANRGAEIWYEGRTQIERQQVILPSDRELFAQLTTRRGWPDSKGRLELEGKEAMRRRGLRSPDRADAILGAMTTPFKFEAERVPWGRRDRIFIPKVGPLV